MSISVAGRAERPSIVARTELVAPATKGEDAARTGFRRPAGRSSAESSAGRRAPRLVPPLGGGGAAVVLATPGDEIRLARGAELTLVLDQPIEVRVPITKS
jgi:hypothetical protein